MQVSELNIYPIKSGAPISVESAAVEAEGLAADRRFMVINEDGECITAREQPRLLGVSSQFDGQILSLSTADDSGILLEIAAFPNKYLGVTVWKDHVHAQQCSTDADELLSDWLGARARLVYLGDRSHRAFRETQSVSFADAAPLLITTNASLNRLNEELDEPVTMRRFRPNIVVDGSSPFDEHSWGQVCVGGIKFELVWACERCVMTTIDEHKWTKDPLNEPLRTLRKLNRDEHGRINFGHNATALGTGCIRVGDPVEILG